MPASLGGRGEHLLKGFAQRFGSVSGWILNFLGLDGSKSATLFQEQTVLDLKPFLNLFDKKTIKFSQLLCSGVEFQGLRSSFLTNSAPTFFVIFSLGMLFLKRG